jgi:hypothetical protein
MILFDRRKNCVAAENSVQDLVWVAFKKWGLRVLLNASLPVATRFNTSGLGRGVFS